MLYYGLDVHRRFIQACCIDEAGQKVREFRIDATRAAICAFADTLGDEAQLVLEATFHTWAIWALLVPKARRVAVANPNDVKAIAHARVKTDKVDAHILAQLLRMDFVPEVRMPEEETWELRQLVTHQQLFARKRTAIRNAIFGVMHRKLLHCPHTDPLSGVGRRWLVSQSFTNIERFMIESNFEVLDTLERQLTAVDEQTRAIASRDLDSKLLMTIPGVNFTVAVGLLAAIGDVHRFSSPEALAAYFGLVPRVRQSANACYHGRITKRGRSSARWLAVEAAQSLCRMPSPLVATYHRIHRRRGHNVAVVALARKLVVLTWHVLREQQPYRYAPVARTRQKLRSVTPGLPPAKRGHTPKTLEEVYAEIGLLALQPAAAGERRAAAKGKRQVTLANKRRAENARSAR